MYFLKKKEIGYLKIRGLVLPRAITSVPALF